MEAAINLVKSECADKILAFCVIELTGLNGRKRLTDNCQLETMLKL